MGHWRLSKKIKYTNSNAKLAFLKKEQTQKNKNLSCVFPKSAQNLSLLRKSNEHLYLLINTP